jgi:hypothetical protein
MQRIWRAVSAVTGGIMNIDLIRQLMVKGSPDCFAAVPGHRCDVEKRSAIYAKF